MYHVGGDKRQERSAALICASLEKLAERSGYSGITITQLATEAGVGRATFYRLFDDKDDVVLYQMEQVFEELLSRFGPESDHDEVLLALLEAWFNRRSLFKSLINAWLYEGFQARLVEMLEIKLLAVKEEMRLDDRSWRYFAHMRAGMLFGALKVAITHYPEDTPESVILSMKRLFGR
ncbi:MAG: TetR/AcrR family transcriptional regulator [Clostridiales bacterium]|jgi:AcrR family transcriptional regulator|nr:TetR/AcrR family transcriptional regulator [Clostridiales bacterium]